MSGKNSNENAKNWFWKKPSGAKEGPVDVGLMRKKVVSGEIDAQTQVSRDGKSWTLAVSHQELGFDCLVLEAGEDLNVLGPFANESMGRKDVASSMPRDGIVFVREGVVGECTHGAFSASGKTGAAMAERVMAAERQLRESEKARRAAETSLAAKDLEFDAERQNLNGVVSGLKAAELKLKAEINDLRSDLEADKEEKSGRLDLEAKLMDAEIMASSAREAAEKTAADLAAKTTELNEARARVETIKAELETLSSKQQEGVSRVVELEKKLADTGARLIEREGRCVELEGSLAAAKSQAQELEGKLRERENQIEKLSRISKNANENIRELNESASWLRTKLSDLAGEVAEKFYVPELHPVADYVETEEYVAEVVEPEVMPVKKAGASDVAGRRMNAGNAAPGRGVEKISAIENQLKRELSNLGAAKAQSAAAVPNSPKNQMGREGLLGGVFKRKK